MTNMKPRNHSIDFFKGFLVVLVVLGHSLLGRLDQSLGRYVIYTFHMPFFIAAAGFLFSYEKVGAETLLQFLSRYRFRLLLPWAIAMMVYAVHLGAFSPHPTPYWNGIVAYLSVPFYHLWFVPAYLFWSVLLWAASRVGLNRMQMLMVSFGLALPFFWLKLFGLDWLEEFFGPRFAGWIIHTLRPHFLLFFALGVGLKVEKISTKTWVFLLAGLMLFGLNVALFYFHDGVSDLNREVILVCMNLSLLVVVFRWIQMDRLPNWQPLEWLGQQSLGIYLWHVLSIFWLKELVGTRDLFRYYAWVGFAQIVLVFIIYLGWRYWRGSRYILGER